MILYDSLYENLWEACGFTNTTPCVISVVGAGGKSHLIHHFSRILNQKHISHFVTTTTHMWPMDTGSYGQLMGAVNSEGKVESPDEKTWQGMFETGWPILIEADGSKGLPCKAPAEWEPVIREETTHVFGVLGMQCLGKSVESICHRPEYVQKVLECSGDHVIQTSDLAKLFTDKKGLKKNVRSYHKYFAVLNQIDDMESFQTAYSIKSEIDEKEIENLFLLKLKED